MHGDVHFGEDARLFVEGKSALVSDRELVGGRRDIDRDEADLQQLFADYRVHVGDEASVTLRPGRQSFQFGAQRLVSPLPWGNTLRTWDGASALVSWRSWSATAFYSEFVPVDQESFNEADSDLDFYGLYASCEGEGGGGLDVYWLGYERPMAAFNGTAGREERDTMGARAWGAIGEGPADYEVEAAWQFGEVGSGDVSAYMLTAVLGYRPEGWSYDPRFWLGFDYASGDDAPGGDVETFNQLFPLGHAFLGYMDFVGRQNVVDLSAGASVKPADRLTLNLAGHFFQLADESDALYNAGGGVGIAGGVSDDAYAGVEVDLTAVYKYDRHLAFLLGYSHFFAGDVQEDNGFDDDADFAYFQLQYTF